MPSSPDLDPVRQKAQPVTDDAPAKPIASTPRADGFRMPGEYEAHAKTWMLWPQRPDNWRLGAKPAQQAWVQVASAIWEFEPVTVGVNHDQLENARSMLPEGVRVVELSSNDAWIRDCGPTFVVNDENEVRLVDWEFNAWGGLYDSLYSPWDDDQMVPSKIAELERVGRYRTPLVLEGGSIHVDGEGTVITTEECLLSPGRNPQLSREEIEAHLRDYLSVDKIIWLARGIDPHETNGHVDDVACFVAPGVVLAGITEDRDDWRYALLEDNLRVLQDATDARGRRLRVETLPMPASTVRTEEEASGVDYVEGSTPRRAGDELAASYLNFLIVNGGVIMPTFDDPNDAEAGARLEAVFPGRRVVTVPGREIVLGGGGVHCITQQQPAGSVGIN
jgi:agmatine deiminase